MMCRFVLFMLTVMATAGPIHAADWWDTFYQYRIPVQVKVKQPGWQVVPFTASDITAAIGKLEEYSFDPRFLAYNHVRVVEQHQGRQVGLKSCGFYLVVPNKNLLRKNNPALPIPTRKGSYYLVRFSSGVRTFPPTINYEQVFPVGEPPRNHAYMSSYLPRLLPRQTRPFECLLQSDGNDMKLVIAGTSNGGKDLSVAPCQIAFLARFKTPGLKQLYIYYQPFGAHYLKIPRLRCAAIPSLAAGLAASGPAQKHRGRVRYLVRQSDDANIWFGETTVKLTPQTPVPSLRHGSIRITTAANESQSFQVVAAPKRDFKLNDVRVSDLTSGNRRIPAAQIEVRQIEYVPVNKRSRMNQVRFFGKVGDPLLPVRPQKVHQADGNLALWVTIRTPPRTAAGKYRGTISIVTQGNRALTMPLELEVYNFSLPEYSMFHTHAGGQFFAKTSGKPIPNMVYHGVKTKAGLQRLARKYYEVMAKEKFYPKNVALFVEVGMKWQPPPKGYKVDVPGNFFRLVSWDFQEFNATLRHFINKLKVNSVCLNHTNPSVSHIFKHLPGRALKAWNKNPGHATMGWQTFRKMTQVTYDKKQGDPWFATSIEVSRKQWDRLILDYYRAMAANLDKHGWLDKFYILIDETTGTDKILHLVKLLKSDKLTAKIRIAHCLQGFECLWHRENGRYVFTKSLTYVPQIDENYYRWENWYWADYGVPRKRDRLWSYAAYSSRLGINVPGLTNREIGLEVFNLGGSGFVIWDTFMWHHPYGDKSDPRNPWQDPYAKLANGALCYFYPPRRQGFPAKPDFTVTPSLRIMTYREGVDDYEYARILEDLMVKAKQRGVSMTKAKQIMSDIRRMFPGPAEWTLNDAWYIHLRDRMARSIEALKSALK